MSDASQISNRRGGRGTSGLARQERTRRYEAQGAWHREEVMIRTQMCDVIEAMIKITTRYEKAKE